MNLLVLRKEIDNIDNKLLEYLAKRNNISKKIGEYKRQNGIKTLQPNRRQEVLENKKHIGEKLGLSKNFIENIWNLIHQESLNMQK